MIAYAEITEKGSREINEDYIGARIRGTDCCFAVADGLGGHDKGEVASGLAVAAVLEEFEKNGLYPDFLPAVFEKSQSRLLSCQKQVPATSDMKTTLVVCCIDTNTIRWAHVGDTRLYFFERGRLKKRTLDHSVPQMLVYAGEIKEKDIRFHPDRNRLMKVMGSAWETPAYEVSEITARNQKQAMLLCTDGFWELIDEKKMVKCLRKAKTVWEWAALMKEVVLKNGKNKDMDNFSAICIWCD